MAIPQNITKEDLLKAIEKIDTEGIPVNGDSQTYDVVYSGKRYPPKLIVSYANLFANGEILDRNSFEGGENTACFTLLEHDGFEIRNKKIIGDMTYFEELEKFLIQARTGELGTKTFLNNYLDLSVRVSFGQGNPAQVPWIAFLKEGQTVQNGIYPVFLYFKNKNLLILAYGVSETNKPATNWNLIDLKSVDEYFSETHIGKPERYGNSYIYKTYDTTKAIDKNEIDKDLFEIINLYKNISFKTDNKLQMIQGKFNYLDFYTSSQDSNLFINKEVGLRFIASLLTKPFVILTGLSGSGKTKLAQAFVMWICENENQYSIVPVGADWTNREPLLGFPNALKPGEYIQPDNKALDLIIAANKNPDKPYFLILDEMNLSHVERYFADFLSVMESGGEICLHSGNDSWSEVPASVRLPKNLFIIGTVNIDETTYMFSPKVLDRANVIEFRVAEDEMKTYLANNKKLDLDILKSAGAGMANDFVNIAKDKNASTADAELTTALLKFFVELKKTGAEFGYRSAAEIIRFAGIINKLETSWTISQIIDASVMQKLLPKVHGSRKKLEPVLKTLIGICLEDGQKLEDYLLLTATINFADDTKIKYPLSLEKIIRMYHNLINNSFTSYAEA